MTTRARTFAVVAALAFAGPALAQRDGGPPRILLDAQLRASRVEVLAVEPGKVVFVDGDGRERETAIDDVLALLPPDGARPASASEESDGFSIRGLLRPQAQASGVLTLVNGERYPGSRASSGEEPDSLVWLHPSFGRMVEPLERISTALLVPKTDADIVWPPEAGRVNDIVVLTNRDRMDGFIASVGESLVIETEPGDIEIPINRVIGFALAAPVEPLRGTVVWLDDGTIARVASIEPAGAGAANVTLEGGQRARRRLSSIERIVFHAERLTPLSSLEPASEHALGGRRTFGAVERAPGDWAGEVRLPGPMTVRWTLPTGAARFAGVVEMPADARPWGDFEFVVRIDGDEALRERLHSARTEVEFSVQAAGRSLEVSIEPGRYGPINDRAILKRALLLVSPEG